MRVIVLIAGFLLAGSVLIASAMSSDWDVMSPAGLALAEGFEAGIVPPAGWDRWVTNEDYTWEATSAVAHTGSFAAQVGWDPDASAVQNEYLLSPPMSATEATLSFWSMSDIFWCRDAHNGCELFVWLVVGEVGGGDDVMVGKADDDWIDTDVWSSSSFDLTPFLPGSGTPFRVAFNFMGWSEREGVALDDVLIVGESLSIDLIFADGFDSGDTTSWSESVP